MATEGQDHDFNKFTGKGGSYWRSSVPSVTCNGQSFRFNKSAWDRYFSDNDKIQFWIDEKNDRLGMEPVDEGDNAYSANAGQQTVQPVALLKAIGLHGIDESVFFEVQTDEDVPFPYVDLPPELTTLNSDKD